MAFSLNISYVDDLLKNIEKLKTELVKPRELRRKIATYLLAETQERFNTETDPWGQAWQPSERVLATGGKTLHLTARLVRSFKVGMDGANIFFGQLSNVKYFPIHQWGGATGRGHRAIMPARPMLPIKSDIDLPPSYVSEIEKIIRKWADDFLP
jgi:phage virion morphogenesis protein